MIILANFLQQNCLMKFLFVDEKLGPAVHKTFFIYLQTQKERRFLYPFLKYAGIPLMSSHSMDFSSMLFA